VAVWVWFDNLRPLYGLLCAFLKFMPSGGNIFEKEDVRKYTVKAAKIMGFYWTLNSLSM
jgi:hypothetical protein